MTDALETERKLKVLLAVRLKGRGDEATVAATVDEDPVTVASTIADLAQAGLVVAGKTLRISPEGRAQLTKLLAQERSGVDTAAVAAAHARFRVVNADFKALVSDWQSKDGQPNTHDDADYDAVMLARLHGVHQRVMPIITAAAAQLPRLTAYAGKLAAALANISTGETIWFTRPIIDSYHTVWFELHEELIQAAGLSREEEAKRGDAG
ncbi:MAG: hypothetical protein QOE41_1372 [Mycobacterium sp.]|nr:hypothetical protein [Mycobacterium sp.]MDT5132061.1 hypothetical protein [Mycobacterium sp.]